MPWRVTIWICPSLFQPRGSGHRPMRAALSLDRNSAVAHGLIGGAKYFIGRGDETEAHTHERYALVLVIQAPICGWCG